MVCCLAGCGSNAGPPIAAIVEGDSMAPTICGEHLVVSCDECQFSYKSELIPDPTKTIICPNCGYAETKAGDAKVVSASEVKLQPYSRPPRRWDVVGFRLPVEANAKTGIKRIVGLPRDEIEIRSGDIWLRDKVLRKSWELQKQIRIPVFDSSCDAVTPFDNRSRLQPSDNNSAWVIKTNSFRFSSTEDETTSWLDFVQWRNCKHSGERDDEYPIEDYYGFNQSVVRELNNIDDVFVELDAEFEIGSKLKLAFRRAKAEYILEIERTETEYKTTWQGSTKRKPLVLTPTVESDLPRAKIEFSSFDRTLGLRIDGTNVFELRENETSEEAAESSVFAPSVKVPFRIGGTAGMFRINQIRIWRDIYYLNAPSGFAAPKNTKLNAGPEEYVVLGDNSPQSLDSRTWQKPGISRADIIGKMDLKSSGQ